MRILNQHLPVLASNLQRCGLATGTVCSAGAPVHERTGVTRVMQNLNDPAVLQGPPKQVSLPDSAADATRKQPAFLAKSPDRRGSGCSLPKRVEEQLQR